MASLRFILTLGMLSLSALLFAQRVEKVRATYTYHAPENITLEQAKRTALERAKLQAVADEFGTVVSQSNTTFINNRNGESTTDFFSLGGSEVRGEWIETTKDPLYTVAYEQGMLVVSVVVEGRIREITSAGIDFQAEVLCNGTDLKFARTDFKNEDDLYLYFRSPVDGYLAVYLLDDASQTVYCLLPYRQSSDAAMSVRRDTPYILFSAAHAGDQAHLVDEYTMTSSREQEHNTLYIVFSPNPFTKANTDSKEELLPRELGFEDFQKWQSRLRNHNKKVYIRTISLTINS